MTSFAAPPSVAPLVQALGDALEEAKGQPLETLDFNGRFDCIFALFALCQQMLVAEAGVERARLWLHEATDRVGVQ